MRASDITFHQNPFTETAANSRSWTVNGHNLFALHKEHIKQNREK